MEIINTGYEALISGILATTLAQIIKFFVFTVSTRKINFKILTTTGGMPSSHSAGVISLSTTVGLIDGFDSLIFAVALGFAFVVMYDATGIRRAAGKTAACLNKIMEDFYKHNIQTLGGKLKELLGHTPLEVIIGGIFGALFAYGFHLYLLGKTIA